MNRKSFILDLYFFCVHSSNIFLEQAQT